MKSHHLLPMTLPERVQADYDRHEPDDWSASDEIIARKIAGYLARELISVRRGHRSIVQIAGNVICRQRPGTAKGFVFISLEDETGVSNAIVTPDLFEKLRLVITEEPFLIIEGEVQNSDGVVLIKAQKIKPLAARATRRKRVARFPLIIRRRDVWSFLLARLFFRRDAGPLPAIPCGKRPACRSVRKCARRKSLAAPGADLPAIAPTGNCRNRRETR